VPWVITERHEFTSGSSLANYGRSIAAAAATAQLLLEGCHVVDNWWKSRLLFSNVAVMFYVVGLAQVPDARRCDTSVHL
jgi:hypothetical protein